MTGLFEQRGEPGISLADRPQTRLACQQILRFIHQQKLKVGDRLPPGNELSQKINICSDTFHSAMRVMTRNGMLERKQKRGTIIQRLEPGGQGPKLFTVGLLWCHNDSPFMHLMFNMARHTLHHHACDDRSYLATLTAAGDFELDRQPQLLHDIERGLVDGLLSYGTIQGALPIPVCNMRTSTDRASDVTIDSPSIVRRGLRLLAEWGCVRPLVIYAASHRPALYHMDRQAARQAMIDAHVAPGDDNLIVIGAGDCLEDLFDAHFRKCPADRRPDGVIVTEDHQASRLSRMLRADGQSPRLVVQTNRQLPMDFALPVIRFEVDADAFARRAVDLLVDAMLNRSPVGPPEKYPPRLCLEDLPADLAVRLKQSRVPSDVM